MAIVVSFFTVFTDPALTKSTQLIHRNGLKLERNADFFHWIDASGTFRMEYFLDSHLRPDIWAKMIFHSFGISRLFLMKSSGPSPENSTVKMSEVQQAGLR